MKNFSFDEAMCFAYGSTMLTGGSSIGIMGNNPEYFVPKYGFVVGGIVPEKSCDMDNKEDFKNWYNHFHLQAEVELKRELAVVIGTWVEDGRIVFDLCSVLDDKQEALALAKKRGERAIYDLENQKEIFVK